MVISRRCRQSYWYSVTLVVVASTWAVVEMRLPEPEPPQPEQPPEVAEQYSCSVTRTMLLLGWQPAEDEEEDDDEEAEQPVGSASVAPESSVPT